MDDSEHGRLIEELTLQRVYEDPTPPIFAGYGGAPRWWNYWGRWRVPASWNPKNKKTIAYLNREGKLHRIYGPAYINTLYGVEAWYKDGELHRIGGPAYTHSGNMTWFKEGKLHNLEGPAVVERAGPLQFWINGEKMTAKEYKRRIASMKKRGLIK